MSADEEIGAYYARGEERDRLSSAFRLEFARTQDLLARHLPAPPAVVVGLSAAAPAPMRPGSPGSATRCI